MTRTCRAARAFNVLLHETDETGIFVELHVCCHDTAIFVCFFFQNPKENKVDHLLFSTLCKCSNRIDYENEANRHLKLCILKQCIDI
jgi:hypothetical protein